MKEGFDERFALFPPADEKQLNRMENIMWKQAECDLLRTSAWHRAQFLEQSRRPCIRPLRLSEGGLFNDWDSSSGFL